MKQRISTLRKISRLLFILAAAVVLDACSESAGDHISKGIRCMETPLASFCAPVKVETNKLKYEAISRNSDETILKSHGFLKKYSNVFFGISKKDASCKDSDFGIESRPTKAHFYKFPEGEYKICIKYYLSSSEFQYKSSEPIKIVSSRQAPKNTESWFVKEIRKHSERRNSH